MKTLKTIMFAALAALSVSCVKDAPEANVNQINEVETLTLCTESATKTFLNGKDIHWSETDVIAVYDDLGAENDFAISGINGSSATFSGNVTSGTTQIYAVYPSGLAKSVAGSTLTVNIPSEQSSKAGSFAENLNISVAKASRTPGETEISGVTFRNVCALLKFTVPSYISDVATVTVSSASVIAGDMTVDYSGDVPACSTVEGSTSVTMNGSYEAGSTFWFVLAPVTLDGITVTITTSRGVTYSMSLDAQVEMTAGRYKNLGTLDLKEVTATTASAAHTYSSGVLTGTEVTVNLDVPQETSSYVTALNLSVKNSAGTVVRTLSQSAVSGTVTIPASTDYPYLPQGSYTVEGSYTLSGNTEQTLSAVSFTVGAPEFTVVSNAYSSYTKYSTGDSKSANKCVPNQIYDITSASISISDEILSNTNYSGLMENCIYKLDGTATTASSASNQSWGVHNVTVVFKFDGVTAEDASNCHITGLPYTLNVSSNSDNWSESGYVKWGSNSAVRLGYNWESWGASTSASIAKSDFNLPENIAVNVNCAGTTAGTSAETTDFSIKVSGTSIYSITSAKSTSNASFDSGTLTCTMTTVSPSITCSNSRGIAFACSRITSLTIKYAE